MRWTFDDDLSDFATAVLPWAEREPVLNNVLHTVLSSLVSGALPVDGGCLFGRCHDSAGLHAVLLRTGGHPALLTAMAPAAATALAGHWGVLGVPELTGPGEVVRVVVAAVARPADLTMRMRIYQLDAVIPPRPAPGVLRAATSADEPLAVEWSAAFSTDARTPIGDITRSTRTRIAEQRLWFWEIDGEPVSMVSPGQPAAGVVRVGLVYTPSRYRGSGYASAAVAAVSQRALDAGARGCMLYADLANPTSNAIYQAIGYRSVADVETWRFRSA